MFFFHTQPNIDFVNLKDLGTELNTKFENIISSKFPKINNWIFGHTHEQHFTKKIILYILVIRVEDQMILTELYIIYMN